MTHRAALPRVRIHYAVKANSHPEVLRIMREEQASFEVASLAELESLLSLGAEAPEIFYSNPIKPKDYIEHAARAGVRWFAVDSVDELRKIVAVKPDASLFMRIETQNIGSDWPLTGKFGVSVPEAPALVDEAVRLRADLAGVSFGVENAKVAFELATS